MFSNTLRALTVVTSLVVLAACSEQSPVAPLDSDAVLASGKSGGGSTTSGRVEIALTRPADAPFANAKGKARYSSKSSERELQVEVENVPVGTVITFAYNGVSFGTATANALREARINVNSKLGQTVPMVGAGGLVTASTTAGAVIVSGSF